MMAFTSAISLARPKIKAQVSAVEILSVVMRLGRGGERWIVNTESHMGHERV